MPRADKKKSFPTFCPFLLSMDYRIYDLIYIENKQWFKCFVTQLRDKSTGDGAYPRAVAVAGQGNV